VQWICDRIENGEEADIRNFTDYVSWDKASDELVSVMEKLVLKNYQVKEHIVKIIDKIDLNELKAICQFYPRYWQKYYLIMESRE
jgi:hypothetical protein